MNYEIYQSENKAYIKYKDKNLNTASITKDSSYPMISQSILNVILDVEKVTMVDACGISWVLEFSNKLAKLGVNLYVSEKSKVFEAVKFLALENDIRPAANLTKNKLFKEFS
jgi:hypothetical protein